MQYLDIFIYLKFRFHCVSCFVSDNLTFLTELWLLVFPFLPIHITAKHFFSRLPIGCMTHLLRCVPYAPDCYLCGQPLVHSAEPDWRPHPLWVYLLPPRGPPARSDGGTAVCGVQRRKGLSHFITGNDFPFLLLPFHHLLQTQELQERAVALLLGRGWSSDKETGTTATTSTAGCVLGSGHFTECFLKLSHLIFIRILWGRLIVSPLYILLLFPLLRWGMYA